MSRQGSQLATTPKVSIGTVDERPHFTRSDSLRGDAAKSLSTSPHTKVLSKQHVGAMRLVHQHAAGLQRLFGVENEGQGLVFDIDLFGRVLGQSPRVGDHRGHPFARIARDFVGQRPARHVRRIEPGHQRQGRRGELGAVEHIMHARHFQRAALVDADDARGGVRAGHQRDVLHIGQHDIGDVIALAGDEAAVLADAAIGRDVTEMVRRFAHFKSTGRLAPRMRSAASAMASTIWA